MRCLVTELLCRRRCHFKVIAGAACMHDVMVQYIKFRVIIIENREKRSAKKHKCSAHRKQQVGTFNMTGSRYLTGYIFSYQRKQ